MDGVVESLINDLYPIYSSIVSDEELLKNFKSVIGNAFNIDSVNVISIQDASAVQRTPNANTVYEYVVNTGKYYIDNQLSEYSSFQELISYKNKGFASYAIIPIAVHGKTSVIIELLSKEENKFSDNIIHNITVAATSIGIELSYRNERAKNIKLATYFNSSFNNIPIQMLVSSDNQIVKTNKSAFIELHSMLQKRINEIIGVSFDDLLKMQHGKIAKVSILMGNTRRIYYLSASQISDKLVHVAMSDSTDIEKFASLIKIINKDPLTSILYLDEEFNIIEASESIEKLTGYPSGYIAGKNIIDLVIEKDRSLFKSMLSELKQKGTVSGNADMVNVTSIPTHLRYAASNWAGGFMLMLHNANSEKYLSGIKEAFFDFMNSASDIVINIDNFGYIKSANMPIEEVLGYKRDELIGKDIKMIYAESAILDRDIAYIRNGGKVDNSYIDLISKSGEKIPATHSIRAFVDVDNDSNYTIVIKELETKHKLRDQEMMIRELQTQLKRLHSTSDLKSQFIYNISHELKTPLTNIKGFSKLLYNGEFGNVNDEQKEYISTIIDEANRLMLIIQQVLDAAKLESNKVKLELKEVDMRDLYENPSIKALQESAISKGLAFSWDVAFDVPKVYADPNRLIQVFVNLIGNSIKFTEKGGISVKINRKGSKYIQCDVIDTGIGISDEDKHKLFRKFYEVPKRGLVKPDGAGTGLGLSIARDIVKLHGGNIGVESKLGNGSRFWFTVRIKPKVSRQKAAKSIS
ncbi:MAG: ATP-binding protein [Candidatus Micrarchaeia archaeon]